MPQLDKIGFFYTVFLFFLIFWGMFVFVFLPVVKKVITRVWLRRLFFVLFLV